MPTDVTAGAVLGGLRTVLDTAGYRQQARRLASEICAMPSPGDVAARLGHRFSHG